MQTNGLMMEFLDIVLTLRLGSLWMSSINYSLLTLEWFNNRTLVMHETTIFFFVHIDPNKGSSGNNIDIYMQSLIEEVKLLWNVGARIYYSLGEEYFQMHVAMIWTINDFPAYANISRWSTKAIKLVHGW